MKTLITLHRVNSDPVFVIKVLSIEMIIFIYLSRMTGIKTNYLRLNSEIPECIKAYHRSKMEKKLTYLNADLKNNSAQYHYRILVVKINRCLRYHKKVENIWRMHSHFAGYI